MLDGAPLAHTPELQDGLERFQLHVTAAAWRARRPCRCSCTHVGLLFRLLCRRAHRWRSPASAPLQWRRIGIRTQAFEDVELLGLGRFPDSGCIALAKMLRRAPRPPVSDPAVIDDQPMFRIDQLHTNASRRAAFWRPPEPRGWTSAQHDSSKQRMPPRHQPRGQGRRCYRRCCTAVSAMSELLRPRERPSSNIGRGQGE